MNNGQLVEGLTLLDYFAANALSGLLSSDVVQGMFSANESLPNPFEQEKDARFLQLRLAQKAYGCAIAMQHVRDSLGGVKPPQSD